MPAKPAIAEFFTRNNIQYIFQIPGFHTLALLEEIIRNNSVTIITGRHESNVIFMADGYARASGKPGVLLVTPGPGLGNIVSGFMEGFGDDIPLLIIFIDVDQGHVDRGILHGVSRPESIFQHFTKMIYRIDQASNLAETLDTAYRTTAT